jgi:hypothetical protein
MVYFRSVLSCALAFSGITLGAAQLAAEDTLMLQKRASIVQGIFEDISFLPTKVVETWVRYFFAKHYV